MGQRLGRICDCAFGPGFGRGAVQTWGPILSRWDPRPPPNLHHKSRRAGLQNITCFPAGGCLFDIADVAIFALPSVKKQGRRPDVSWYGIRGSPIVHEGSSRIIQKWVCRCVIHRIAFGWSYTVKYLPVRSWADRFHQVAVVECRIWLNWNSLIGTSNSAYFKSIFYVHWPCSVICGSQLGRLIEVQCGTSLMQREASWTEVHMAIWNNHSRGMMSCVSCLSLIGGLPCVLDKRVTCNGAQPGREWGR